MALSTYQELKTSVADWAARDDLASKLDDFIKLTEAMINRPPSPPGSPRVGGVRLNKTSSTGVLTPGVDTLSLPSDYLEIGEFYITESGDNKVLQYLAPEQLQLFKRAGSGRPSFYTVTNVIELDVAPDSAYDYEFTYYPKVSALSAGNTSNTVLTNHPDVYLHGCLYQLAMYTRDETGSVWLQNYKQAAWEATRAYARGRAQRGPVYARVAGRTP